MGNIELETAWSLLINETEKYLSEYEIGILNYCYLTASPFFEIKHDLNESQLLQSLGAALELARLQLDAEFVASAILYYPVCVGALQFAQLFVVGNKIISTLKTLIDIRNAFDKNLFRSMGSTLPPHATGARKDKELFYTRKSRENAPLALMALSKRPEIVIMKVIERLYLLEFIEDIIPSQDVQGIIAQEALDLYAQIAEILGIWSLKSRLEDLAFKILDPESYGLIKHELDQWGSKREKIIDQAIEVLQNELKLVGINAKISGRPKHIYGIYLKMKKAGNSLEFINDNLGIRILLNSEADCYHALNILHKTWPPALGIYGENTYRDWIAHPKPNSYQSIHTTVTLLDEGSKLLEVQIRTHQMHDLAEYGICAHWIYKDLSPTATKLRKKSDELVKFRRYFEEGQNKDKT